MWLGIDVGTGGSRALLIDERGAVRAGFTALHEDMMMARAMWAEQRPENWWDAVVMAVRGVLEKAGDNLYKNTSNLGAEKAEDAKVRQGFLESSNVKPVLEITRMVEVSRAYEQTSKMIDSQADLSRRAVDRLGRVQ